MKLSAHATICTLGLVVASAQLTLTQATTIADGVVPLSPGIEVRVIREGSIVADPLYCCCNPQRLECRARYETVQWVGVYPGLPIGADATASTYQVANVYGGIRFDFGDGRGTFLQKTGQNGITEEVARLYEYRCADPGCTIENLYSFITPFYMDVTNGRITILTGVSVRQKPNNNEIDFVVGLMEISGLPQMFDTLLTFLPSGGALTALTPAHPDGFRSADSLQLWTGDVRTLPDWSRAQPITCNAATSPAPGQVVTVAETLPDPPVGQSRYYLTASVNGADRRLGRQYINGAFSARDPASLPVCEAPADQARLVAR